MRRGKQGSPKPWGRRSLTAAVLLCGALWYAGAGAFDLTVQGDNRDGTTSTVASYRYLIEEDRTFDMDPAAVPPPCFGGNLDDCLSVHLHTSHMPVVAEGNQDTIGAWVPEPGKRYFISVLPDSGYAIGGVPIPAGATSAKVVVQAEPIPTAQIRVFLFHDNFPTNNAPDTPEEQGLGGWRLLLEEAGGKYGASAGMVLQDAYGNPLGTTYNPGCDPYDPTCVAVEGSGIITTGPCPGPECGFATIENLVPGKYGIIPAPPETGTCPAGWSGSGKWQQVTTIEGKKVIDAWVKANEPAFFTEFGPPGPHVFIGFIQDCKDDTFLTGAATISGQVRTIHMNRPPEFGFHQGFPVPGCWVALNTGPAGTGRTVYAGPCDEDSNFTIPGVPDGNYELVMFDANLDMVIGTAPVTVQGGACPTAADPLAACNPLDGDRTTVFPWFSRLEAWVFNDKNANGFWDPAGVDGQAGTLDDELGIPEQAVNLRFRDGTLYQSFPTDLEGFVPFDEVFPFFNYLTVEVDFARFKATGLTKVVDAGGPIPPDAGWANPSFGLLNPQPQHCTAADVAAGTVAQVTDVGPDGLCYTGDDTSAPCAIVGEPIVNCNTGNNLSHTETGQVLTAAFQGFLGQTSVMQFGKKAYGPGENGGISGIVYYAVTRAEDDPRFAAAEPWEPGIPRIQMNLYADADRDGVIDDLDGDGCPTPADVDNYPFGWRDGGLPGPEDFEYTVTAAPDCVATAGPAVNAFSPGDAIQITTTDSWDDSQPVGCQGEVFLVDGVYPTDCFDGLRNFNQVRPGVFDGGYAFDSYFEGGMASTAVETEGLPSGTYIVESGRHPVYHTVKEEDRNVDFGDEYKQPELALLPPVCVGESHLVPPQFSLFPHPDGDMPFRAGQMAPLCDRKQVAVKGGSNTAADFFNFTYTPISGHIVGFILNDLANEFDPNSPTFGEKYSPPSLPVSVRDWTGRELYRTYSDRWGGFNMLVPSTFTMNVPFPSGMSPNMLITCMNDPGPIPNPDFGTVPGAPEFIEDPNFDRQHSQFCYTFQYAPGSTTYLDTPVVPVAAFAGPGHSSLDCEFADGTPVIWSVNSNDNTVGGGPYVNGPRRLLTITSAGTVQVPNPEFDPNDPGAGVPDTIPRDYGFGRLRGQVFIGGVDVSPFIRRWSNGTILLLGVPASTPSGQLRVVRGDNGRETQTGLTVTFAADVPAAQVHQVPPGGSIQAVIDAPSTSPGDLILVPPGSYEELVIMDKPVRLQGWGAASTLINAVKAPGEKLQAWRSALQASFNAGKFTLLPGQEAAFGGLEPDFLLTEQGPGIVVLAKDAAVADGGFGIAPNGLPNAWIDGLGFTGADQGGAIFVNGYARDLVIGNNRVFTNTGVYGGGIRVGHPFLVDPGTGTYADGQNLRVRIHHNQVVGNGGQGGFGGGISVNHGTHDYRITDNWVCGNFTQGDGGGIGHYGLSQPGLIAGNTVIFNQSFNQGLARHGGGIYVGGADPLPGMTVTPGSGTVTIDRNLIQGNNAGAGDGGGLRLHQVNGQDFSQPGTEYWALVYNNLIADNVAGTRGGGISLQDVALSAVVNNTIVNNDSTATTQASFQTDPNFSDPQPAGVVSYRHSAGLLGVLPGGLPTFSSPSFFQNNVIRHNRSFRFQVDLGVTPPTFGLVPDIGAGEPAIYDDLEVVGVPGACLAPSFSTLSEDIAAQDPACAFVYGVGFNQTPPAGATLFVAEYFNGDRGQTLNQFEGTTIATAGAFDEGGNFIDVRYAPLTLWDPSTGDLFGDYHLAPASVARNSSFLNLCGGAIFSPLCADFDGQARPEPGTLVDRGGDEAYAGPPVAGLLAPQPALASSGTGSAADADQQVADIVQTLAQAGVTGDGAFAAPPGPTGTAQPQGAPAGAGPNLLLAGGGPQLLAPAVASAPTGVIPCSDVFGVGGTAPFLRPGSTFSASDKCFHLTAGDGFINTADGRPMYEFGFRDVTQATIDAGGELAADVVYEEGFLGAEFPAPTIVLDENEVFYLSLTNVGMQNRPDLFDPHTVHFHGDPNASTVFDGLPESGVAINQFATLTYYYQLDEPGTYMYHCHVEATEHMQMGMLGSLYVRPAQNKAGCPGGACPQAQLGGNPDAGAPMGYVYNDGDGSTAYDVEYPIQLGSFDSHFHDASWSVQPLPFALMKDDYPMINGRGYPRTVDPSLSLGGNAENNDKATQRVSSLITATAGDKILLRISNLAVTRYYTLSSPSIPMKVIGKDARLLRGPHGEDLSYTTNSVEVGGGESFDVILDSSGVAPGTYFLHAANLEVLSNNDEAATAGVAGGMMTEIVISAAPVASNP
ncbi:MAG: hypothetical protein Kow0092_16670 [Deferrisomatales bacterium]